MNQQLQKDFEQSSPSCSGLEYLDIQAQTDMRYSQESNTAPLNLESSTPSTAAINLYPSGPVFNPTSTYQPDSGSSFYPSTATPHIFSGLDVRPRLGNTSNPSSGMAHAHRAQLPHPGAQITSRDLYSSAAPSFRRTTDTHSTRSPSFPASLRHHPLSPTPSPGQTYTAPFKMDAVSLGGGKPQIPPLMETTSFGTLQYTDGPGVGHPVKVEINGTIDKGFFLADKEWTCYRRNYFSCICSFSLSPHYPGSGLTFVQTNGARSSTVQGFAMGISAVVSDNDSHIIDLVQHTPKRDKGPTARPEKMRLMPKPPHSSAHHAMGMYGADSSGVSMGPRYDHGYGPPQTGYPNEHTFERIQFKQATANNGKRRAAQQYYHLLVELWVNVGSPSGAEHFIKVAHRKSAKMIVRGRSPGHYQADRRGSASSGPGGSAGSLGGYGSSQMVGSDFGSAGSSILPGAYGSTYDPRSSSHYGSASRHHQHGQHGPHGQPHDMSIDHPMLSSDDVKAIAEPKEYQYFPTPICDSTHDPRQPVEMFSHPHQTRGGDSSATLPHMNTSSGIGGSSGSPGTGTGTSGAGSIDAMSRVKSEGSQHDSLPSAFYTGSSFYPNRCGRYEGKPSSSGYYPSVMPPTSSMTMS